MSAILFGSISTVADTSELQREAFNQAFDAHGLGWRWDRDEYLSMLGTSGGRTRIAEYAAAHGQTVDAAAVHDTKSTLFQQNLAASGIGPRAGVVETIRGAKDRGLKVGLVTTTSTANVEALIAALAPAVRAGDFDVIVDASSVEQPKPDKAAYEFAVASLGEDKGGCVAVEDNVDGVRAAAAAGLPCVAFPNENTAGHDFSAADRCVDHVDIDQLAQLITADGETEHA